MSAQKKTSKKTSSSIIGTENIYTQQPVTRLILNDVRIFASITGATSTGGTTFYTVPAGKRYRVENAFIIRNANITAPSSTAIQFRTPAGSVIWEASAGITAGPETLMTKELYLYAGDTITLIYQSSDVAGIFSTSVTGIEEQNFLGYPL